MKKYIAGLIFVCIFVWGVLGFTFDIFAISFSPLTVNNSIMVDPEIVNVDSNDGDCSLIEAIENANDSFTGQPNLDCLAGNPNGADTIVLATNSVYSLTEVNNGVSGLPVIISAVMFQGNGAIIQRDNVTPAPEFRIFHIGETGFLNLTNLTVKGGNLTPNNSKGAGIYNAGKVAIVNTQIISNSNGGQGGGLFNENAEALLERVDFRWNTALQGGGISSRAVQFSKVLQLNSPMVA